MSRSTYHEVRIAGGGLERGRRRRVRPGSPIEPLEKRALLAAVASVSPVHLGDGVGPQAHVQVTFASAMTASSITGTTYQLLDGGSVVNTRLSYNSNNRTATLDSRSPLAYNRTYSVLVKGGSTGVKDSSNGTLPADFTWSFTTAPAPGSAAAAGAPILIITASGNPFSNYYSEILRAEGLNAFDTADISTVSASKLANYKLAILSQTALLPAQVTTITDWVNGGGKLIAMKPDKQLAGLLGLSDTGATIFDTYMDIDNATAAGAGLTATSMQYHGQADRYTLSGAVKLADLFSNSTTATGNPAVTMRAVGSNGGQAAAFVYDLAKSVIYTRQGNPAWSGQERDGISPIRSDDLFYGGASPDWVDLSKVAIPQADEQQRLLANILNQMAAPVMPLPRFWYFPNDNKALVVMTGDDHNSGGTAGRWTDYLADGTSGGMPIRGSSYIFPNSLTNAQVASWVAQGFEPGLHIDITSSPLFGGSGDVGINWTSYAGLDSLYTSELNTYNNTLTSVPTPTTVRTHAIVWSDYDSQPQVEFAHRIRLDTNYYYWPGSWIADRPGMFTGSGMPMRFAKLDGSTIDVYQATTQITDESNQTQPKNINALLDGAIGANGYYGAFTINAHTDSAGSSVSDAVITSAKSRNVPVITADALLNWTDGRNNSSFDNLAWDAGTRTLSFTLNTAVGAGGLRAMVPLTAAGFNIASLMVNGSPAAYIARTIKGVAYAFFDAVAGSVSVQYAPDTAAPTVTVKTPPAGATAIAANVKPAATFSEDVQPGTIAFVLRDPANNAIAGSVAYDGVTRTATFTPGTFLNGNTTYTATVSGAKDPSGNTMAPTSWSFTTAGTGPFSIWSASNTPTLPFYADSPVELGVKFKADIDGFITGIRFYKGSGNTGTHTGSLWTTGGTRLATATFGSETASGWQQVNFTTPAAITAGTTYVASYHTNTGYAADEGYFGSGVDSGYLHVPSDSTAGGNGVYRYGSTSAFPNNTWGATNYWVDVVYSLNLSDTTAPTVTTRTPASAATGVAVNTTVKAAFSEPVQPGTISFVLKDPNGVAVAGATAYDSASNTATFTPSANLNGSTTYTATVSGAKDAAGNTMATTSWSFTTAAVDITPPAVIATTPASGATAVAVSAALSATFSESVQSGTIAFTLRDPANNPAPTTTTYNDTTKVATFTPTSPLSGLTTYTATISGAQDGSGNTMAPVTWSFTTADATAPTVIARTPAPGASGVSTATAVTATFSEPVQPATISMVVRDAANNTVAGATSYDDPSRTATFTPTAALASSTTFTVTLSGAKDTSGNTMNPLTWSFTTIDNVAPTVTATSPAAGATGIAPATAITATFSEAINAATLSFVLKNASNATIAGSVSYNVATRVATFTPSAALAENTGFTATVSASDLAGNAMSAPKVWSFTTGSIPVINSYSFWDNTVVPATTNNNDGTPIELGMKFRSAVAGSVTGVRFYKGTANTGTHSGSLWSAAGTRLATVTFTGETASGWQTMQFSSPVAIAANTTYIVSYFSPTGTYAADGAYFTSAVDVGPIHALANSESPNGLYRYTAASAVPNASFNSSNYWVDVVFQPAETNSPAVQSVMPATVATGVSRTAVVSIVFSEPMDPSTINSSTIELRDPANNLVAASVAYNAGNNTATITPSALLASNTTYTVIAKGGTADPRVKDISGNALATNYSSTFTTLSQQVWTQTSTADFSAGTTANTAVTSASGGEVQLAATDLFNDDFSGTALSSAWTRSTPSGGSGTASLTVSAGILSIGRTSLKLNTGYAGAVLEGSIAFPNAKNLQFGYVDAAGTTGAMFLTKNSNTNFFARVRNASTITDVNIGTVQSGFHVYRIVPVANGYQFLIDGVLKTTIARVLPAGTLLQPWLSAQNATPVLRADYIKVQSYPASGTFVSSVLDTGQTSAWSTLSWNGSLPSGTGIVVEVSSGDTALRDGTWSPWTSVTSGSVVAAPAGRYFQYRITFTTSSPSLTPVLSDISLLYS